jgi:hypothetical protein
MQKIPIGKDYRISNSEKKNEQYEVLSSLVSKQSIKRWMMDGAGSLSFRSTVCYRYATYSSMALTNLARPIS